MGYRGEARLKDQSEASRSLGQAFAAEFLDLSESHCAANGMAKKGTGVNGFPIGGRPSVHPMGATDTGTQGKPSSQGFTQTNKVWNHSGMFASKPSPSSTETRVNFIENQQSTVVIGERPEQLKKLRRRNSDTAPSLHGFN